MSEFKDVAVGAHLKLTCGFPFASSQFSNEGFPLIRIRDVLTSQTETYFRGVFPPGYIIKKGDILVGMDGDFHVVKWRGSDALLNQRVLKVDVQNESAITLDYLFHWLGPFIKKVNDITAATTVKHLSTKDLTKVKAKFPGVEAQRKIAAILTATDIAIEKTEALIAKYQQIKAGLMHDLFTRGVLPNGQLRPPREQAPELYLDTAIGWIPREWEVVSLASVSEFITSGSRGWADYYSSDGALFIRIGNLTRAHPNFRWDSIQRVKPPIDSEGLRTRVASGDILISITADLGISAVVGDDLGDAYVNQHIALVRPDRESVNSRFVGHYFGTRQAQFRFQQLNDSGAKAGLNLPSVGRYLIPRPTDYKEAEAICLILDGADINVRVLNNDCEKLRQQKLGLMQDLLTGNVTVRIDESAREVVDG